MNRLHIISLFLVFLLGFAAGCSKKDSGPTGPSGGTQSGDFQEVEPNDFTPQGLGVLGNTDDNVAGSAANATDVDRYSITLNGQANLLAKVSWQGTADLDLWVTLPNGVPLVLKDTGGNTESCLLADRTAGTYVIQITSKQANATAYVLTIGVR